ncbi:MAG: helix-turn-helix transcriptional regulator [Afipia sp.]|nr:helix-turn-helix transcriptional regulator [Afipia sp.]
MATRSAGLKKSLNSADHRRLLALLIETRERAGLTQRQVAAKLQKTQSFVAKYEIGERRLDVLEFIAVAGALGADPLKMFKALLKS